MEELLKTLREKAKSCGDKTKESMARKGAYVDCIILIEKQLHKNAVVGRSEQLLAFKKWEAEKCKLPWDASPEQIIEQYISQ